MIYGNKKNKNKNNQKIFCCYYVLFVKETQRKGNQTKQKEQKTNQNKKKWFCARIIAKKYSFV